VDAGSVDGVHPIEWLRAVARSGGASPHDLAGEAATALAALADEPHDVLPACRRLLDRHPSVGSLWWACARMVAAADPSAEADAIVRDLDAEQTGLSLTLDLPESATVTVVGWTELADELAVRRGDLRILAVVDDHGAGAGGRRSRWSLWEDGESVDDSDEVVVVPRPGLGAAVRASDVVLVEALAVGAERVVAAAGTLAAAATARQLDAAEVWLSVGVGRRLPDSLLAALEDRVFGPYDEREPWKAQADRLDAGLVHRVVEPLTIPCPAPPELLRPTGRR
jgi:hypothetical protein